MKIDNRYRHHELYVSLANKYRILPIWEASLSYDLQYNSLWADMNDFAMPRRISNYVAMASSVDLERIKLMASATALFIHDRNTKLNTSSSRSAVTPALYASIYPLRTNRELSVRAFAKQSYRMPTFNDLYYTDMGNAQLKPERVTQFNVGLLFDRSYKLKDTWIRSLRIGVDAYCNMVTDKIVAYPKGQQFRWTMLNLGKVDIKGIDVSASVVVRPVSELLLTFRGQYTFQRAIDITDLATSYYRHQIPYIPRHSGSAVINASFQRWALNVSYVRVGSRYNKQENIHYNYMRPWQTTDMSLSRDLRLAE